MDDDQVEDDCLEKGRSTLPLRPHVRARTCGRRGQLGEQVDRHARAAKRRIPAHDLAYQPILGRRSGRADSGAREAPAHRRDRSDLGSSRRITRRARARLLGLDEVPCIAGPRPASFEPREAPAYLVEDEPGPVAVLDRCRVDDDAHRQPFSVDQGVDFAALHLLTGVVRRNGSSCP
jgi:hypothetical protein